MGNYEIRKNVEFTTISVTITIPVERIDSGKIKTKSERFQARKDSGNKKEFIMHLLSVCLRTFYGERVTNESDGSSFILYKRVN